MGIRVVTDEPARKIEMLESQVPVMVNGLSQVKYCYHARRNEGEWLSLETLGNRIPEDW